MSRSSAAGSGQATLPGSGQPAPPSPFPSPSLFRNRVRLLRLRLRRIHSRFRRRRGRASSSVQAVCPLQVVAEHKHDPKAFTQGLLCKDEPRGEGEERCARFWESTGLYGETSVRVVDRLTGKVVKQQVSKRPFCAI